MQDVEITRVLPHPLEHQQMMRQRVAHIRVEAKRPWRAAIESRGGDRIATGEQRHVVALSDQLLGQVRNDALGAAVKARRDALGKRGNLGDFHDGPRGRAKSCVEVTR